MTESRNIHQRLHAVMNDVAYIQKEKKQGMNYTIVSHDAVTAKVRPALVKHGVIYYPVSLARAQDGNRTEIDLTVRFVNIDDPADFIDVVAAGYGIDNQDKGPGKAISYAVKYCLLKALGLETGDDPDHESIEHQPARNGADKANGAAKETPASIQAFEFALAERLVKTTALPALDELWREVSGRVNSVGQADKEAKARIIKMFSERKAEIIEMNESTILAAG